jgi:hypothetical protein
MDSTTKCDGEQGALFTDINQYQRLVGMLTYLTMTRPNITYFVGGLVSICMLLFNLTLMLFVISCII